MDLRSGHLIGHSGCFIVTAKAVLIVSVINIRGSVCIGHHLPVAADTHHHTSAATWRLTDNYFLSFFKSILGMV